MPESTIELPGPAATVEEFLALRATLGVTPRGGAALFVVGLLLFTQDEPLGLACLGAVLSPEHVLGDRPSNRVVRTLRERLLPKPYVARSYFEGTAPEAGYSLGPGPCSVSIEVRPRDQGARSTQVFVRSTGASPRPMTLVVGPDGIWRAERWSSLEVGISTSGP